MMAIWSLNGHLLQIGQDTLLPVWRGSFPWGARRSTRKQDCNGMGKAIYRHLPFLFLSHSLTPQLPQPPRPLFIILLLAKILVFSDHQIKYMETEFGGNRKMALILSWYRGEHSRLILQELCPPPHEKSGGFYKIRAHSQESVMRNKGLRILISSSCIILETVMGWCQ